MTISTTQPKISVAIRKGSAAWLLLGLLWIAGCGEGKQELPATFPAKGTVLQADGTPLPGGLVEFRSTTGAGNATGRIQPDGTFSLMTLVDSQRLDGAIAGTYQATIMPLATSNQEDPESFHPIQLADSWEVTAAGPNEFEIKLPARGR